MSGELMKYATGEDKPRLADRQIARQAKAVHDQVRMAGMKGEGAAALAAHLMEGAVELNNYKEKLAQDDPTVRLMLTEIQVTAMKQMGRIQRELFDSWGL